MAEAAADDPHIEAFALASSSAPVAASPGGVEVLKPYSLAAIRYLSPSQRRRTYVAPPDLPAAADLQRSPLRALADSPALSRAVEVAVADDHSLLLQSSKAEARALAASPRSSHP
jgi:hypothetical protein